MYKVGDIVKHTCKFLQSIQWNLDVPKNGRVLNVRTYGEDKDQAILKVEWCDGHTSSVKGHNIMLDSLPDYS